MPENLAKIFWLVFFLILGGAAILFILPSFWLRLLFGLALFVILAWTIRFDQKDNAGALSLIAAYIVSVAQFALQFVFSLPAWLIMIFAFVWVSVIFWVSLRLHLGSITGAARILSLVAGLAGAEIALALMFWPTHFLVTATVFFLLFYLLWITAHFYISGLLNRHRVIIHTALVSILIGVILIIAEWTI